MDGLEHLSQELFDSTQVFHAPPPKSHFPILEITHDGPSRTEYPENELSKWVVQPTQHDETPPLKMIRINRNLDVSLGISKETFLGIFNSMRADPSVLYMICRDYDGFHEYSMNNNEKGKYLPTRFVGTSIHAILWTFNPATSSTVALFFNRRRDTFVSFCDTLSAFSGCVHTPHIICFAIALHQLHWFDVQTSRFELSVIRRIEERTGYGPNRVRPDGTPWHKLRLSQLNLSIDEITEWSQSIGEVAGNFANKLRHQKVAGELLDALIAETRAGREHSGISEGPARERYRKSMQILSEAVPGIKRHMQTYSEFLKYLQDRAERLSGVLFALLTHEDAAAGVILAEKAKRDASSMKTVAIMTMAFLPGTFIAALFSMPSLEWDKPGVVHWSFGVYWALTLPVTALVFGIWLLIVHKKHIRAKVEARMGSEGVNEKRRMRWPM